MQKPTEDQQIKPRKLYSNECVRMLGGTIGSLLTMADPDAVRQAVAFWASAESSPTWQMMTRASQAMEAEAARILDQQIQKGAIKQ